MSVAHRHGLALDPAGTSHVADVAGAGDLVIAVCDNAHEDLAGDSARAVRPRLHWSVPDPVRVDTDEIELALDEPVSAISPGQSLVLYDGDRVLGGGFIEHGGSATRTALPVIAA